MSMLHVVHVNAACPGQCCTFMSMPHVQVNAARSCQCRMFRSMLVVHVNAACSGQCWMSMSMLYVRFRTAYPCRCYMSRSERQINARAACSCPCSLSMSFLHGHVHATYLSMLQILSMLHVDVDARYIQAYPFCMSFYTSILHAVVHVHAPSYPWLHDACPCACPVCMYAYAPRPCLQRCCPWCMSKLHIQAVCQIALSMLLVHAACPICTSKMHVHVAYLCAVCPCCMPILHVHVSTQHVNAAYPHCSVHAVWTCELKMLREHEHERQK